MTAAVPRSQEAVMPGRLRALALFSQLTAEQLIVIASRTQLKRFRDGDRLLVRGDDDQHEYFLLDGNVAVSDAEGNSRLVAGGTPQASSPLAPLRPSPYEVRAIGPVVCAKLHCREVAELRAQVLRMQAADRADEGASRTGQSDLLAQLEADLAADRLKLPSLPDIALRLRGAIAKPTCDNRQIADLLAADPAVAAKILKIANSPLCRGAKTVSNLRDAVMRIGWVTVSELVVCFSLKDIFRADSPDIRERFAALSGAAVRLGATASVVAERAARPLVDQALTAGLLCNIGALPLLERLTRDRTLQATPAEVDALLAQHAAKVGESICRQWALGDTIADAVRHADDWTFMADGPATLAEVVIVARYHALLGSMSTRDLPCMDGIGAMRILGGHADPQTSIEIVRESRLRIDALHEALA